MSVYRADFQSLLENYQNMPVAIEFECGGCYKRAAGILNGTGPNYVILSSPVGSFVKITTYCGVNSPEEETASAIVIKRYSIIAVERGPASVSSVMGNEDL